MSFVDVSAALVVLRDLLQALDQEHVEADLLVVRRLGAAEERGGGACQRRAAYFAARPQKRANEIRRNLRGTRVDHDDERRPERHTGVAAALQVFRRRQRKCLARGRYCSIRSLQLSTSVL